MGVERYIVWLELLQSIFLISSRYREIMKDLKYTQCLRNVQQDPLNETWVFNSSSTLPKGPLVRSHLIFDEPWKGSKLGRIMKDLNWLCVVASLKENNNGNSPHTVSPRSWWQGSSVFLFEMSGMCFGWLEEGSPTWAFGKKPGCLGHLL